MIEPIKLTGRIDHDHLFFKANGKPIRTSSTRTVAGDRRSGRSALWVARQHGHSISTMLRFYAAWTDGALEADIAAIRAAMENTRRRQRTSSSGERRTRRTRSVVFEIESTPIVRLRPSHPRICHQGLSAPMRCCPV
jgi:hypothetical protein